MDEQFDVKIAVFKYHEDSDYTLEYRQMTSREDVRKILGTEDSKTYSIHLEGDIVLFANPRKYLELEHMTAHATDKEGELFFWGGDFIACREDGNNPADIDDSAIEKIISDVHFKLHREGGTSDDTKSL